jgi:small subunit ribosomal protein S6
MPIREQQIFLRCDVLLHQSIHTVRKGLIFQSAYDNVQASKMSKVDSRSSGFVGITPCSLVPRIQGAITHKEAMTMPIYESIFIINPNLSDEETAGVIKKMQDVVVKLGGEMLKFEDWGKKKLSYEIKKHKRGHYAFFQFKAAPTTVSELERTYKLTDAVIKFLTVKLEKELRTKPAPKPKKKDVAKATQSGQAQA